MQKFKFVLAIRSTKRLKRGTNVKFDFFPNGKDWKDDTKQVFIATEWEGNAWDNATYTDLVDWYLLTKDDPKWQEAHYRKLVDGKLTMREMALGMLTYAKTDDVDALLTCLNAGSELDESDIRDRAKSLLGHKDYRVRVLASLLAG